MSHVVVTSGFGEDVHFEEAIRIPSQMSLMEGLQQIADVETKYSGGFIHDINNIRSTYESGDSDWFVYINGIQTRTGANRYNLLPGDVAHLDLHNWEFRQFIPSIIGDFPEPFLHGYEGDVRPTIVVYEDDFNGEASEIVTMLAEFGIADVCAKGSDELSQDEKKDHNLILLGDMDNKLIAEMNKIWNRMGFFAHFEEGRLVVVDGIGKTAGEYGKGTGLIQATQNQWNSKGIGACENVVWIVSGTDAIGVKRATHAFVDQHPEYRNAFAAIITHEGVIRIPQSAL